MMLLQPCDYDRITHDDIAKLLNNAELFGVCTSIFFLQSYLLLSIWGHVLNQQILDHNLGLLHRIALGGDNLLHTISV